MGEFTMCTLSSFDPKLHVKCADVCDKQDRQGNIVKNFNYLPYTKSTPSSESMNWAKQSGPSDPTFAFDNHIKVNNPPLEGPLFAYKQGKSHQSLTKSKFIETLNVTLKAQGKTPLQGHSIRIRSTLEYLLCNIPFNIVKVKGRWASNAFFLYLQRHAQILVPYMQAQPDLHTSLLHLTIPPVC